MKYRNAGKEEAAQDTAQLKSKNYGELTEREVRIGNHAGGLAESPSHTRCTHAHRHTNIGPSTDTGIYTLHTQTQGDVDIGTGIGTGKYLYSTYIQTDTPPSHTHNRHVHTRLNNSKHAIRPLQMENYKRHIHTYVFSHTGIYPHSFS